jgi:hypothetical protein
MLSPATDRTVAVSVAGWIVQPAVLKVRQATSILAMQSGAREGHPSFAPAAARWRGRETSKTEQSAVSSKHELNSQTTLVAAEIRTTAPQNAQCEDMRLDAAAEHLARDRR